MSSQRIVQGGNDRAPGSRQARNNGGATGSRVPRRGPPGRRLGAIAMAVLAAASMLTARPADAGSPSPQRFGAVEYYRIRLATFANTPFPYDGVDHYTGKPFFDVTKEGRRGHTSLDPPIGRVYWEDDTYADRRVLLYIPEGFDPGRPALMVVYFHGNFETLERNVIGFQHLPLQVAKSGLNAVLVVPQFAYDAGDSSAGRFWRPGEFRRFLGEAAAQLAALYGDERAREVFEGMPVVLMGFSGAFVPIASVLDVGGIGARLRGVILLDAIYGEEQRLAAWIARRGEAFFFSAYSSATLQKTRSLQRLLEKRGIGFRDGPRDDFSVGSVVFLATGAEASHVDFVTRAWVIDPVTAVLSKIGGYARLRW